jgi:hypothetical protein
VYDGLALLVGGVWRSSAKESFANVHYRRAFLFAQAGIKPVLDKSVLIQIQNLLGSEPLKQHQTNNGQIP